MGCFPYSYSVSLDVSNCAGSHCGLPLLKCSAVDIGLNRAETNCGIAHVLGIRLMNCYHFTIFPTTSICRLCPSSCKEQWTLKSYLNHEAYNSRLRKRTTKKGACYTKQRFHEVTKIRLRNGSKYQQTEEWNMLILDLFVWFHRVAGHKHYADTSIQGQGWPRL